MILENWKMSYEGYSQIECKAPATMYSVLLENNLIKDPFYGLNELELTKLSNKDTTFEAELYINEAEYQKNHIELIFLGLDTICDIYVNGVKIASTKNMHRRYVFDVKNLVRVGKNHIKLDFKSPTKYFEKMDKLHFLRTNGETILGAPHLRKALYMSGWDWGPTLPDMGIFRPVLFEAYDDDKIESIFVYQNHQNGEVTLDIEVETRHNKECDIEIEIDGKTLKLNKDKKTTVKIDNPRLWWAVGYGEQNLYKLTAKILKNGAPVDEKTQSIGLRTLTVSTERDETGSEFCFVLNGVKIFAMGANYVPIDNLLSRITPNRIEAHIKSALDANFNCIRIWGGGYYPEDYFYDLCDKYGLIVWQDTMVACCNIWLNDEMEKELTEETIYNLKRLRSHPSLGLWCGNNEMEVAVMYWDGYGWDDPVVKADYLKLYENILPSLLKEYAPQTFYWQASPSSGGNFDDPDCPTRGDCHFWEVWHGSKPFTEYRKHKFRFCSEYGFESYPSIKTIKTFAKDTDMDYLSPVMLNHQKLKGGNEKILMYLIQTYKDPKTFEELVYASQLVQADAIKYGVEHFRRNRGYTMGSIYWQFNDCWPVASWSSVDSLGRYKALHYKAKRFYAPVLMSVFAEENEVTINISNETMHDFDGKIKIYFCDTSLGILDEYINEISTKRLSSKDVVKIDYTPKNKNSEYIYCELYNKEDKLISTQVELYSQPKFFELKKPTLNLAIKPTESGAKIDISSSALALGIYIDFEDIDPVLDSNFFDLQAGKIHTVNVITNSSPEELSAKIKILSVYDIG